MNASEQREPGKRDPQMFRVSLRAQGVAVLAVPMAALFFVLFSIYSVEGEAQAGDDMASRAYEIRSGVALFHSSMVEAEAAAGAWQATGQTRFQSSFESARASVEQALSHLGTVVTGDPETAAAISELKRLSGDEFTMLAVPGNSLNTAGSATAGLQERVSQLNRYADRRLTQAQLARAQARQRLSRTVIWCGILGPLGALFIHLLLAGRLVKRLKLVGENARRLAHGMPMGPQPRGSDEIAALGKQLDDAAYLLRARERELRESERRYRDLFDQAPVPYEETNTEGKIQRFNQAVCSLLRCSGAQIMGSHAWDFVPPWQQDEFRVAMRVRILEGTEIGPFECEFLLEDGSHITVEIRENLIRNEAGDVTGVRRSLLDVTQRNMAVMAARKVEQYAMELRNRNEQLAHALDAARHATEAKSRFLASVSHELRTPLNGIIGFSELLYDGKLGPVDEGHREVLGDILTSGRHLLQLINDILDLSKVEAGKMEFRPVACQLDALVLEVRDVIRPLADKKGIALTTDVPAGFDATIDPSRFKQVLYNYLSNAVKFTPESGSVKVVVAPEGDDCFRLEVEDTGIGIAPDQVAHLFQEFHQVPNSRKPEQGTGLGLALTRHIVEAQSGTVGVRSRPGRGSVFSAVLPLRAPVSSAPLTV